MALIFYQNKTQWIKKKNNQKIAPFLHLVTTISFQKSSQNMNHIYILCAC